MKRKSGMPGARHEHISHLYDEVQQALDQYAQGIRPTSGQIQGWHRYQVLSFLQGLPHKLPVEDCEYFDNILELEKRNDIAIVTSPNFFLERLDLSHLRDEFYVADNDRWFFTCAGHSN